MTLLIYHDPDEWTTVSETHTCPYHEANPEDRAWPGCTCSASYGMVRRPQEEIDEIKRKKREEHEENILAEAAIIQARRAQS
jgi:hypothetical protein